MPRLKVIFHLSHYVMRIMLPQERNNLVNVENEEFCEKQTVGLADTIFYNGRFYSPYVFV